MKKIYKLLLLVGIFTAGLLTANVISTKIFTWHGITITVGILLYPITFAITDTVSECYGKEVSKKVVWTGFFANVLMLLFLWLGGVLPPASFWQHQEAYEVILGAVPRITIASLIAYIVSQTHDVWAFHFWKEKTGGKHLWLRNNLSTIVSQAIDTVIFIGIAFIGTMPWRALGVMMLTQYIMKFIFALLDTPFVYWLVAWVRKDDDSVQEIKNLRFGS